MATLAHFVRCYPDILGPKHCAKFIDAFEAAADKQTIHQGDFRFAEINVTQDLPEVHDAAFQHMLPWLNRYAEDVGVGATWPAELAFEELRMKRYLPNDSDEFPPHVDVMDHASARRFLVAFFYLNDVEDGGETEFPGLELGFKPKAGSLLLFPPLWPWLHAGRKPVSGPKYILGTYLHYI